MVTQDSSRRRRRSWLAILLAALGLALVAAGWRQSPPVPAASHTIAIVVTTRAIGPGQRLTPQDVEVTRVDDAPALEALLHDESQAVGRSARVALATGVPLSAAVLSVDAPPQPGQRRLRLRLDQAAVPPELQRGDRVEVVAAVADGQALGGGRVGVVGEGRVAAVEAVRDGGASSGPADVVTLDIDAVGAGRVLWAEAFAKSVRLLVRPAADASVLSPIGAIGP